VTSGIRIGSPAITTRGLKEKDCVKIVGLIDEVLTKRANESELKKIKKRVNTMMEKFPLFEQPA
jgi:glycine hydroxymethyltransferase